MVHRFVARRPCLAALALCAVSANTAWAQWGGSVVLASDNRIRGASFSDQHPDLHLGLAYDGAAGLYGGGTLAFGQVGGHSLAQPSMYSAYAGYVRAGTVSWEGGLLATHTASLRGGNYWEAYSGLLGDNWSSRLYWSPRYLGQSMQTAYLELGASQPLGDGRWRLVAHLGALRRIAGTAPAKGQQTRLDGQFGVGRSWQDIDMLAAFVTSTAQGPFSIAGYQHRSSFTLTLSHFF